MGITALLLLLLIKASLSEVSTIPLPPSQCPSSHIWDDAGLLCEECEPGFEPQHSGSVCGCPTTSLQANVADSTICSDECRLEYQAVSLNQEVCVPCNNNVTSGISLISAAEFDTATNDCICNSPNYKLVEIYDESGLPKAKGCSACPAGQLVITEDLYRDGHQYYATAGKRYVADPYYCASCPDPNMHFDSDYNCVCKAGFTLTGEASVGEQSCIKDSPTTMSSSYSMVEFRDPAAPFGVGFTLESITFSHMYLRAAAECEHLQTSSSCQALGNLCVMSSYDEDSAPCKQFKMITERQAESYHNQEDWKKGTAMLLTTTHNFWHTFTSNTPLPVFPFPQSNTGLPWLYYQDEPSYTMSDSISLEASFQTVLKFKLAKYTLDGTFLGLEDFNNQFEYCLRSECDDDEPYWLAFGNSHRREYDCSVEDLLQKDMFLYDMYLVTPCEAQSSTANCLYPVRVLNRNVIKDNRFPNLNRHPTDEVDDIYTRRFFVLDNQSGRTSSGPEAVRYAKKIVLEIKAHSENPSRIYPPRLVVEYISATSADGGLSEKVKLLFKLEYSMDTKNFWDGYQLMIGFLFTVGCVVFGVRMNSWTSRQRYGGADDPARSTFGLQMMLHGLVIACHTFALLFFGFTCIISLYWFLFFKLQNQVFLLLPPGGEFGESNEYQFFAFACHALFWCQTVYVFYQIFKQSQSYVIFVDWEEGKHSHGASMWRMISVTRQFLKMQAKRRTCMEFSLLLVAFFMIGFSMETNSYPQPFLGHSTDAMQGNIALSFANTFIFFWLAWSIQVAWRFLVYERWIEEPPCTKLVDLCTVSNISMFMLKEHNAGYMIHGRSPYSTADCSMEELLDNLLREGNGLMIERGLDGSSGSCQTFQLYCNPSLCRQISTIYDFAYPNGGSEGDTEKLSQARHEMKKHFSTFIDERQYIVRSPTLNERSFGLTPAEFRTPGADTKSILLQDEHGWTKATLIGLEMDLLIHDVLTYNVANLAFDNAGISIFITYIMHLIRRHVRLFFGTRNLAKSSFIHSRFLG